MALDFIQGNDLVSAVSKAVRAAIPQEELPYIYKDKPRQGFKYCSLFIDVLQLEQSREMRQRGQRTIFLDLLLHPERDKDTANSWCRQMAEKIMDAVDTIQFKGQSLRAVFVDSNYSEKEQIHHVFIVYRFKTLRAPIVDSPGKFLETLQQTEHIKYGKE